jgi:hypothetical protein
MFDPNAYMPRPNRTGRDKVMFLGGVVIAWQYMVGVWPIIGSDLEMPDQSEKSPEVCHSMFMSRSVISQPAILPSRGRCHHH